MIRDARNGEFTQALRDAVALTLFLTMAWLGLAITQAWAEGFCPAIF